jgi:gamma-glutamylcyclotransferase (GGCT)/AIG2-like uncharacterized protein YtfP
VAHALRALGRCLIAGLLVDLGDYPGLVEGRGEVAGELFEILDPAVLDLIDVYEEHVPADEERSVYLRRAVPLIEPRVDAWVYFYNRSTARSPLIASGDWAAHVAGRDRVRGWSSSQE